MSRKKGTAYLRFCALDVREDFLEAVRDAAFDAGFDACRRGAAGRRDARAGAGRAERVREAAGARLGAAAARGADAARVLSSSDRDERWTRLNRIWSPRT